MVKNDFIIVTGGAGFIGSNIVKALNEKGYSNILIVDELDIEKLKNLTGLEFSDAIDKDKFLEDLHKYSHATVMFHMGACSSTTNLDVDYMMNINYEYSKRMYEFCQDNSIRYLYASSASTYGDGENGFVEGRDYEDPLNPYAYSKFLFDNFIRSEAKAKKIKSQVTGLRFFNVFGYQENHKGEMASVVKKFNDQFNNKEDIKIFKGSDKILRDFIFIEDVVRVCMFFAENVRNGIFNVGTGKARSFQDLADAFKAESKGVKIKQIPFPNHLKGRYQFFTQADMSKLREVGFDEEFTSLEESVKKYLKVLRESNGYLKRDRNYFSEVVGGKVATRSSLKDELEMLKKEGKKIIFTNGCFDILHKGHVSYLNEAKALGDVLVVGLNSDRSVKSYKGEDRPLVDQDSRAFVLSNLKAVDYVTIFDERLPSDLIGELKPDVHVKAGDYTIDQLPEAEIVYGYGGDVKILNFVEGHSSTKIINKMKD